MLDSLKNLFQNRRTVRFASEKSIPDQDIEKLIYVAKLAPSADKLYAYKIYVLTNSLEGFSKKRQMIEFARCGPDVPGDPWTGREINLSLISGVVFYFTVTGVPVVLPESTVKSHQTTKLRTYSIIDASINATMIMMAAESMGYKTAFISFITDSTESRKVLTGGTSEEIILALAVSQPRSVPDIIKVLNVNYKNQRPFVITNKGRDKSLEAPITVI
jgi:nitroreductase